MTKKDRFQVLLLVLFLFFLTKPYFFWNLYGNLFATLLVSLGGMMIIWQHTCRLLRKQRSVLSFYVILCLFFLVNEFSKGSRLGVVAYSSYILLGFVPFIDRDFGKKVFDQFTTLYALLIGLSMAFWIAAIIGMIAPIGRIELGKDLWGNPSYIFLTYPFCLVSIGNEDAYFRFSALFDEPGVVGTLGCLILCGWRFNMRDWRCVIILLSCLLSSSMFFYGAALVYVLSYSLFVKKRIKEFLIIVVGVSLFFVVTKDNDIVYHIIWSRFEWDSNANQFVGSTRGGEIEEELLDEIMSSGEIWLGVNDKDAYLEKFYGTSSIYGVIAIYGVMFVIPYLMWLLMFGRLYKSNNVDYVLYCFLVLGCAYQRTGLFNLVYTFLYVCNARYYDFQSGTDKRPVVEPTN